MSGSNNRAQEAAQREEQRRQQAIRQTQGNINSVFDNPRRQAEIADFGEAVRQFHTEALNRQKADTDRELKFAIARGGLAGGSTQIDQQGRVAEDFGRGLLEVQRRASGAKADLQAQDQDARSRLLSLATTGLDATTGAQQAAAAMRSSLEAGKSTSMAQGLGDMFTGVSDFLARSREAAGRRRANAETGFSPYQPGFG